MQNWYRGTKSRNCSLVGVPNTLYNAWLVKALFRHVRKHQDGSSLPPLVGWQIFGVIEILGVHELLLWQLMPGLDEIPTRAWSLNNGGNSHPMGILTPLVSTVSFWCILNEHLKAFEGLRMCLLCLHCQTLCYPDRLPHLQTLCIAANPTGCKNVSLRVVGA